MESNLSMLAIGAEVSMPMVSKPDSKTSGDLQTFPGLLLASELEMEVQDAGDTGGKTGEATSGDDAASLETQVGTILSGVQGSPVAVAGADSTPASGAALQLTDSAQVDNADQVEKPVTTGKPDLFATEIGSLASVMTPMLPGAGKTGTVLDASLAGKDAGNVAALPKGTLPVAASATANLVAGATPIEVPEIPGNPAPSGIAPEIANADLPATKPTPVMAQGSGNGTGVVQVSALPELSVANVLELKAKQLLVGLNRTGKPSVTYDKPVPKGPVANSSGLPTGSLDLSGLEQTGAAGTAIKMDFLLKTQGNSQQVLSKETTPAPENSEPAPSIPTGNKESNDARHAVIDGKQMQIADSAVTLDENGKQAPPQVTMTHQYGSDTMSTKNADFKANVPLRNFASGGANAQSHAPSLGGAPIFRQVVENLEMKEGGSHVRIQLHPESLGKVEVSLIAKDLALEVRIVADSPQAAEALQNNIHELTQGLQDKASRFHQLDIQVEVRDQGRVKADGPQPERRDQQRGQERGQGRQEDRENRDQGSESRHNKNGQNQGGESNHRWWRAMKEES